MGCEHGRVTSRWQHDRFCKLAATYRIIAVTNTPQDCEATPGFVLTQIRDALHRSIVYRPNVVLINGGTNDANLNIDVGNAGSRMRNILNDVWAAEGMADTCIMLSTLLPTGVASGAANQPSINAQYRSIVSELFTRGHCIYLAELDDGWISLGRDMISDGIHPNDEGHRKMAAVFYKAITKAHDANRLVAPSQSLPTTTTGCDKVLGNGVYAGGLTQQGSGDDDGIYYHKSQSMGKVLTITSEWDRNQWRFARLFGQNRDDLVAWFNRSETEHAFAVWKNLGDGNFDKIADLEPDLFCNPPGLHFIDMNGQSPIWLPY